MRHIRFFLGGGGHVCVVGLFWRHWASVLDDFRVIWGAKMKLKSILRHLVGPMAPPRGFLRAQGCHFGGFGGYFGIILGTLWGAKLGEAMQSAGGQESIIRGGGRVGGPGGRSQGRVWFLAPKGWPGGDHREGSGMVDGKRLCRLKLL